MIALARRIIRNRLAAFGAAVLMLIFILSLLTPVLGLPDPNVIDTSNRFMLPFEGGIFSAQIIWVETFFHASFGAPASASWWAWQQRSSPLL